MKFNKLVYIIVYTFAVANISNASNSSSLLINTVNNINSNNQILSNNNQNESNNNNDAETLSGSEDDYRTKYIDEYSKKDIEITFGNKKNNNPYKVIVNSIYNSSSSNTNFSTIKKLANSLSKITNDVFSANKGKEKYNKKAKNYTYTLDNIIIDNYKLNSLTLNGNDSKNPSIVNLNFDISKSDEIIPFNNIKCNNISKLNLSFKNNKSPFTYCKINNITTNNDMNITLNIPVCIGTKNKQYFNYSNNSVNFDVNTSNNVIQLNQFYFAINQLNDKFLEIYSNEINENNVIEVIINGENIEEVLSSYYRILMRFPPKNKYWNKTKKLNMPKYRRTMRALTNIIKLPDFELKVLKCFYNVHKMLSNDLYNVLK